MHRRNWLVIAVVCSVTVVAFMCVLGWKLIRAGQEYLATANAGAGSLREELAAAKREGLPLEPGDLRPKPPISDDQNAAVLYWKVFGHFKGVTARTQGSLGAVIDDTATSADIQTVRTELERRAADITVVEQGSLRPYCEFHYKWEDGPAVLFPEAAEARDCVQLLAARAVLESREHPALAWRDIATIARIGKHMEQVPSVIFALVDVALTAFADRAWRRVVRDHADDPAVLLQARRGDDLIGPAPELERAFRGEVVMCRVWVQYVEGRSDLKNYMRSEHIRGVTPIWADGIEARLLHYWRRVFALMRTSHGNSIGLYQALRADGDKVAAGAALPGHALDAYLVPIYAKSELKMIDCDARRSLRQAMLGVLDFRVAHHRFPDSFSELPATPPIDPFSGHPLHYHLTGTGFVLYSVGENLRDDGGKTAAKNPPDIVVTFP